MLDNVGSTNIDSQIVEISQSENDLTIGNMTQMAVEKAEDIGNGNLVDQNVTFLSTGNNAVNGHKVQQADIDTNS